MAKLIFINLPVSDLARATVFYQAIGAVKNARFSDDTASCMVFSDTIHAMLMTHDKYRQFTTKKIADAKTTSQVLICIPAPVSSGSELQRLSIALLQNEMPVPKPVRLLGVSLSALQDEPQAEPQLGLPI
jgi:predicted lactoylglutathione lyase